LVYRQGLKRIKNQWFNAANFSRVLFLGAFAKLRKAAVNFVMSFRPSARMEQICPHWTGFHEIYLRSFPTSLVKIPSFIKIGQD